MRIQTCSDVTENARHGTPPRLDCTIIVVGRIDRVSERRRTVSDHRSDLVATGLAVNRTLLVAFKL